MPLPRIVAVYDLETARNLCATWARHLPGVHPLYAVKANDDPQLLKTLASCGAGFDVASPAEVRAVLAAGASPETCLYANPNKHPDDLRAVSALGLTVTTVDTPTELEKIAAFAPGMSVFIRIWACDPNAVCPLSNRFGARPEEWEGLLDHCSMLGLRVIGVAFHVGSGAKDPRPFADAIRSCRQFVDLARARGHDVRRVDLGGGFTASNLECVAAGVGGALQKYFSDLPKTEVFAEPGRFLSETVVKLFTQIISVRRREKGGWDYVVFDSIYGHFSNVIFEKAKLVPRRCPDEGGTDVHMDDAEVVGNVYGATCDGFDVIAPDVQLPPMRVGEWLAWDGMGAYTSTTAMRFNGLDFEDATARVYVGLGPAHGA